MTKWLRMRFATAIRAANTGEEIDGSQCCDLLDLLRIALQLDVAGLNRVVASSSTPSNRGTTTVSHEAVLLSLTLAAFLLLHLTQYVGLLRRGGLRHGARRGVAFDFRTGL